MSDLINLIVSDLGVFRSHISDLVYQNFPSPNAELILGLLIGANDVKELRTFNDMMRGIGLVHVVVVSGYNINLVFDIVLKLVGSRFKFPNLFLIAPNIDASARPHVISTMLIFFHSNVLSIEL